MNLGTRYWRFSAKASWLSDAFVHAASPSVDLRCESAHRLTREDATVYLQDQWNAFCRDLILKSWRGKVWTFGGSFIPGRVGPRSTEAALLALRASYTGKQRKSKHWEPKWFDPLEAIDAAKRLAVPNFSTIAAGLGSSPSPLSELRAVRNFFVHRGPDSARRLAPFVGRHPTDSEAHSLLTRTTLGGASRFEQWVAELDIMARAAVL